MPLKNWQYKFQPNIPCYLTIILHSSINYGPPFYNKTYFESGSPFLGGLSLHLNHLIA